MSSNYRNFGGSLYWAKSPLSKVSLSPNLFMRRPIFGNLEDGCHSRKSFAASSSQLMFRLNSQRDSTQMLMRPIMLSLQNRTTNRRLCGFQNFESRHRYTLKGPVAFLDLSLVISFNFLYCCRRNNKAITGRSFKKSKGDISTFGIAQAKSSLILAKNY